MRITDTEPQTFVAFYEEISVYQIVYYPWANS